MFESGKRAVDVQIPMGKRKALTSTQETLLALFERLPEAQRETLLSFAEFLARQSVPPSAEPTPPAEPRAIARPEKESVIAAIKRLNATYFMLEDRAGLLNETSALMTQHVMQGRDIGEVIDELEVVFARFYEEWRAEQSS